MFLYPLLHIQCATPQPAEMQNARTARPATEGVTCCRPARDAPRLPNVTNKHTTSLFGEGELEVFVSVNGDKRDIAH